MKDKEEKKFFNLNKKQETIITRILYVTIAAAVLIMLMNMFSTEKPETGGTDIQMGTEENVKHVQSSSSHSDEAEIEERLENILSQVHGAGDVKVKLTLETNIHYEYATDRTTNVKTTEENIDGGSRLVSEEIEEGNLVLKRSEGNAEKPVILKETKPVVKGVIVVAEGANNSNVRLELSRAVETVLGISSHQVNVMTMGGR